MIERALIALFLLPGLAHAVICKTVDSEGVVAYAEVPANECRTPLKLPEYSRYAPRTVQQQGATGHAASKDREAGFEGYESIEIVKPVPGEEILSNEGKLPLALTLEPALQPGHRISVFLDNVLIPGAFDGLAIELTGVDVGGHKVRATVMDDGGTRLIDSAAVTFMLREAEQVDEPAKPTPAPVPE
jgi:hypothetical protein